MTDLITIVSVLGGVQGLFITILLSAINKQGLKANKYLAAVVLILSLTLVIAFLHFSRLVLKVPHLYNITPLFTLLYGPLLFFYVKNMLKPGGRFSLWELLHFVPFLIFIRLQWDFLNMAGEIKASYLMNIFEDRYLPVLHSLALIRIAHLAFYLGLCWFMCYRFRQSRPNGDISHQRRLTWLNMLITTSLLIWGIYTFLYFYNQHWLNQTIPPVITAALYGLAYYAFRFPQLFRNVELRDANSKYAFSKLTEKDKEYYGAELLRVMQAEKLFANPDLKLQTLARHLDISPQKLSQIINERFKQNFSEFVNRFRIEEAMRLLVDPTYRHLSIVAIANEVGFNSKSAFNTAFKKFTQQTPSEYLKSKSPH